MLFIKLAVLEMSSSYESGFELNKLAGHLREFLLKKREEVIILLIRFFEYVCRLTGTIACLMMPTLAISLTIAASPAR